MLERFSNALLLPCCEYCVAALLTCHVVLDFRVLAALLEEHLNAAGLYQDLLVRG